MISQVELIKLIREHTGCGMWDAKKALEKVANDMGVLTRRDRMTIEILNGLLAGRRVSATQLFLDESVDEAIKLANILHSRLERE